MAYFSQCGCRLGSEGGGTTSSKSDPQLRHNDDEETKATTPRQRLSSGAAEAENSGFNDQANRFFKTFCNLITCFKPSAAFGILVILVSI